MDVASLLLFPLREWEAGMDNVSQILKMEMHYVTLCKTCCLTLFPYEVNVREFVFLYGF